MDHNVMLVEGNRLMLEKLSNTIRETDGFSLAVRYQDVSEALGQGGMFHPDLILLDVEQSGALETLVEFRRVFRETPIICIGERWEAETASRLVQEGALGYLIKPFTSEELQSAWDTFSKSGMETNSQIISFFSTKGKSGKTTLIANLALVLARMTGEQIGVIDADLQFGDMALMLNLEPQTTIVEAVRDAEFLSPLSLSKYFLPVNDSVHVLCGTPYPNLSDKVEIQPFEEIVRMAKSLFRYILIDMPPGFCPISISAAELSNYTYVIAMENQGYEIRHVQRALEIFKDWEDYQKRVHVIFTRVNPQNTQMTNEIQYLLEYPVDSFIPNEYLEVSQAADEGRSMLDLDPNGEYTRCVQLIAEQIINPIKRTAEDFDFSSRVTSDDIDDDLL